MWTDDIFQKLDNILEFDEEKKQILHRWLCQKPNSNSARFINQTLDKITFLNEIVGIYLSFLPIVRNDWQILFDKIQILICKE
jgi:hypothetical protein